MVLESVKNEKVKMLKKLMSDKALMFLDNPKLIDEAFKANHKILYIIKRQDVFCKTDYGGEIVEVSDNVFNQFTNTENSQGLIGVVQYNNIPIKKPKGNFLVLDGLQDPGNVGTLIRSALGANFTDIYLVNSAKVTNNKVIRSSMGAIFKTNIYQTNYEEFVSNFVSWQLDLLVCDMSGENIYSYKSNGNEGIVVGNEGNGISEIMFKIATKTIAIPMQNNLESLNAGVSGSIIMYNIANKKEI